MTAENLHKYRKASNLCSVFVSTSCFPKKYSLESLVQTCQMHRLNAVELGSRIEFKTEDSAKALQFRMNFLVHNYFPPPSEDFVLNLASDDADIHRRSVDLALKAIDFAAEVNAEFYSVHSGFCLHLTPQMLGNTELLCRSDVRRIAYSDAYNIFVETIGNLSAYAGKKGVGLLVENNSITKQLASTKGSDALLLTNADEILKFMNDINNSKVGILLDTGHLNVSAQTLGFDRMGFVDKISKHICAFHIHDNDGTADMHLPAGKGSWIFDVIRRPDFSKAMFIIEAGFDSVEHLSNYADWLKNELISVG